MTKYDPIYIRRCANGFIVFPQVETHMAIADGDTQVYETIGHLLTFIGQHFSGAEGKDDLGIKEYEVGSKPPHGAPY